MAATAAVSITEAMIMTAATTTRLRTVATVI